MNPTGVPVTSRPKWLRLLPFVLAAVALGLHLFAIARKPAPWPHVLGLPLILAGMVLLAWSGLFLLPAGKTRARRVCLVLAFVCILAGMVCVILDALGP